MMDMGFLFFSIGSSHSHNSDCSATVMQYLCVIHVTGHQTFSMEKIGVVDGCYTISVQTPQLLKKKVEGKLNPGPAYQSDNTLLLGHSISKFKDPLLLQYQPGVGRTVASTAMLCLLPLIFAHLFIQIHFFPVLFQQVSRVVNQRVTCM